MQPQQQPQSFPKNVHTGPLIGSSSSTTGKGPGQSIIIPHHHHHHHHTNDNNNVAAATVLPPTSSSSASSSLSPQRSSPLSTSAAAAAAAHHQHLLHHHISHHHHNRDTHHADAIAAQHHHQYHTTAPSHLQQQQQQQSQQQQYHHHQYHHHHQSAVASSYLPSAATSCPSTISSATASDQHHHLHHQNNNTAASTTTTTTAAAPISPTMLSTLKREHGSGIDALVAMSRPLETSNYNIPPNIRLPVPIIMQPTNPPLIKPEPMIAAATTLSSSSSVSSNKFTIHNIIKSDYPQNHRTTATEAVPNTAPPTAMIDCDNAPQSIVQKHSSLLHKSGLATSETMATTTTTSASSVMPLSSSVSSTSQQQQHHQVPVVSVVVQPQRRCRLGKSMAREMMMMSSSTSSSSSSTVSQQQQQLQHQQPHQHQPQQLHEISPNQAPSSYRVYAATDFSNRQPIVPQPQYLMNHQSALFQPQQHQQQMHQFQSIDLIKEEHVLKIEDDEDEDDVICLTKDPVAPVSSTSTTTSKASMSTATTTTTTLTTSMSTLTTNTFPSSRSVPQTMQPSSQNQAIVILDEYDAPSSCSATPATTISASISSSMTTKNNHINGIPNHSTTSSSSSSSSIVHEAADDVVVVDVVDPDIIDLDGNSMSSIINLTSPAGASSSTSSSSSSSCLLQTAAKKSKLLEPYKTCTNNNNVSNSSITSSNSLLSSATKKSPPNNSYKSLIKPSEPKPYLFCNAAGEPQTQQYQSHLLTPSNQPRSGGSRSTRKSAATRFRFVRGDQQRYGCQQRQVLINGKHRKLLVGLQTQQSANGVAGYNPMVRRRIFRKKTISSTTTTTITSSNDVAVVMDGMMSSEVEGSKIVLDLTTDEVMVIKVEPQIEPSPADTKSTATSVAHAAESMSVEDVELKTEFKSDITPKMEPTVEQNNDHHQVPTPKCVASKTNVDAEKRSPLHHRHQINNNHSSAESDTFAPFSQSKSTSLDAIIDRVAKGYFSDHEILIKASHSTSTGSTSKSKAKAGNVSAAKHSAARSKSETMHKTTTAGARMRSPSNSAGGTASERSRPSSGQECELLPKLAKSKRARSTSSNSSFKSSKSSVKKVKNNASDLSKDVMADKSPKRSTSKTKKKTSPIIADSRDCDVTAKNSISYLDDASDSIKNNNNNINNNYIVDLDLNGGDQLKTTSQPSPSTPKQAVTAKSPTPARQPGQSTASSIGAATTTTTSTGRKARSRGAKFSNRKRHRARPRNGAGDHIAATAADAADDVMLVSRRTTAAPRWSNGWNWQGESFQGKVFLNVSCEAVACFTFAFMMEFACHKVLLCDWITC